MTTSTILQIPPGSITARQYAGRDGFTCAGIPVGDPEIVESIAAAYDPRLFEPVRVREIAPGEYELIDGHHRLAAALLLELEFIPAVLVDAVDGADRLALQVAANNARAKDGPETLGRAFLDLTAAGMPEAGAARSIGVSLSTARKYAALAQAPLPLREWHRDGRLPLDAVAMIADPALKLAPGTQRRLAELYIREKAERPGKFQPADFRVFLDTFVCKLAEAPPRLTQTSLVNEDEDPGEVIALERAQKALARNRRVDLERDIATAIRLLSDPAVAECVTARMEVITGWVKAGPEARHAS